MCKIDKAHKCSFLNDVIVEVILLWYDILKLGK